MSVATSQLNPKEKMILARLIYRSAMWVSISDDDGGNTAQNLETKVFKRSVQNRYRQSIKSTQEREVLGIILSNTHNWKSWHDNLINLVTELKDARPILSPNIRKLIMDLAREVATAYQERSVFSSWGVKLSMIMRGSFSTMNPQLTPQEYANISASEKAALYELAEALEDTEFNI